MLSQDAITAEVRAGFLERLAQYDAQLPGTKVAISVQKVLGAAERGAASRTPEQLEGITQRALQRQENARDLYRSLPAGDPREALALKRLENNTALQTHTGAVGDQMAAEAERARAAAPLPASKPLDLSELDPDQLDAFHQNAQRLRRSQRELDARAPGAFGTAQTSPALADVGTNAARLRPRRPVAAETPVSGAASTQRVAAI